jgi:hypothetical protein
MCAAFSTLVAMQDTSSAAYRAKLKEGLEHLSFCCAVYRWQHEGGRFFLHEHPHGAWSWKLPMVQAVLSLKEQFGHEVHEATCDQCQFGLQVEGRAARKRTHWATNARCIAQRLEVRCCGGHEHHDLTGNTARHAERYPRRLVLTILRGLREELISEGRLGSLELGQHDDEPEAIPEEGDLSHAPHGHGDDGATPAPTTTPWSPVFRDEYTGLVLPTDLVEKARKDEIGFMNKLGVWRAERRDRAMVGMAPGSKPIGVRWIDSDKGDASQRNVRCRLVVQETKRVSELESGVATFAATPPLEALRFLFSLAMTLARPAGEEWVIVFIDVSRAHPHCDNVRRIMIELPAEAGFSKDHVGVLVSASTARGTRASSSR